MWLPSGRDGRRGADGVLPPGHVGHPLGHRGLFRIQRPRLLQGGGRVGPQRFPCAKASKARVCGDCPADGRGLIGVRQSVHRLHAIQPAHAMTIR